MYTILYNHHLCLWIHDVYNVYNILKICKTIESSLLCPLIAPWKSKDWSLSRSQRCCTATPAGKSICLFLAALELGFQLPPGIAGTVTPACPARRRFATARCNKHSLRISRSCISSKVKLSNLGLSPFNQTLQYWDDQLSSTPKMDRS